MALTNTSVETKDLDGSTSHFNGTVGTAPISVPTVPGNVISDLLISNLSSNTPNKSILVSFDGGTNFFTLGVGTAFSWTCRGGMTQVQIKGSAANTAYEILMNREN